jgi:hypothetical protein
MQLPFSATRYHSALTPQSRLSLHCQFDFHPDVDPFLLVFEDQSAKPEERRTAYPESFHHGLQRRV